ncbi:MAG: hypothetical protein ACRCYC_15310 [Paraclostridium sp.]|uniref:hypothetical protein n=1 Tax=Paraclostridium sp. TaxID=2023273 RepID=UPI003F2A53CA
MEIVKKINIELFRIKTEVRECVNLLNNKLLYACESLPDIIEQILRIIDVLDNNKEELGIFDGYSTIIENIDYLVANLENKEYEKVREILDFEISENLDDIHIQLRHKLKLI